MEKKIQLGIIGTGRIAARAVKELKNINEFDLTTVVNPNLEHARTFADERGIPECIGDIMTADGTELDRLADYVDAVYIAAPHHFHYGYAKLLLAAGKHVICEKPMTFSPDEAAELYDIAEKRRMVLMEGIKTAYCPGFTELEETVASGTIGDVIDVEATFTRLTPYDAINNREYSDLLFGGAFTEFGSYTMLPVFRFLGTDYSYTRFESIKAHMTDSDSVDGYTRTVFGYDNRYATCRTGLTVKSEGQLVISGTDGYILAPSPWWLTRRFEVRFEDPSRIERHECEYDGDGLRYEFVEFAHRICADIPRGESLKREQSEAIARAKVFESFLAQRSFAKEE